MGQERDLERTPNNGLREEKQAVRDYYEQVGWRKGMDDHFADTLKFEDLRPVSQAYIHKCHLRVKRYLKPRGQYLLDVASGPVPYPEYLSYSEDYTYHLCMDLSMTALEEAKRRLGHKGLVVNADITNLPLKDNVLDGIVSLHTIYHVPADEQSKAFREIWRVLKPGSSAVVVYQWGDGSLLMSTILLPYHLYRLVRRILRELRLNRAVRNHSMEPRLYFHAHSYSWIIRQLRKMDFEMLTWRSVSVDFLKLVVHERIFGRRILRAVYLLEEKYPRFMGRYGQYPLFVIKK